MKIYNEDLGTNPLFTMCGCTSFVSCQPAFTFTANNLSQTLSSTSRKTSVDKICTALSDFNTNELLFTIWMSSVRELRVISIELTKDVTKGWIDSVVVYQDVDLFENFDRLKINGNIL